jgi:ubiquinone/menaquinone biosynthesis C-methylase UbiE
VISAPGTDRLVESVEQLAATPGFAALREQIMARARPGAGERVLDVGAGTGLLSFPAAAAGARVIAIDRSEAMCERLRSLASARGAEGIEVLCADAAALPLADDSVDLALSNYCLHHLDDAAKRTALRELARVLRPGGRLVIGDMMFRISLSSPRDRRVLGAFVRRMLARGPAGILRLARNALRVLAAPSERPASVRWWQDALEQAGFVDVSVTALAHEGGIASARLPG